MRAFLVAAVLVAVSAGTAHAQFICANFFPTQTGLYGDRLTVTVTGVSQTATAHGVTGLALGGAAESCTTYAMDQRVARFDVKVVGVDPGEEVWFELNGAAYPNPFLLNNPGVTAQPLVNVGGRLQSTGADGSANVEITEPDMTGFRMCAAGGNGVVVEPVINSFCQCGNGNAHVNEDCDDGDRDPGDGCSDACVVEPGWSCAGNPSTCTMTPTCGNGVVGGTEECDDGGVMAGDGCSPSCTVEPGWRCRGAGPSACVRDADGDGEPDASDNCVMVGNADQADGDGDGVGDACDLCPAMTGSGPDGDGDGRGDGCDNCPAAGNTDQTDGDGDAVGDACDLCPAMTGSGPDGDSDGRGDGCDNCPGVANASQGDQDRDGVGDACEPVPPPPPEPPPVPEPGGCCQTGGSTPMSWFLALAVIVSLSRARSSRRRR